MDFFRRIFNNPENPTQSGEEQVARAITDNNASTSTSEPVANSGEKVTDKLADVSTSEVDTLATGEFYADDTDVPDTLPDHAAPTAELTSPQNSNPMGITRPLPQEPVFATQTGHLTFGQKSDVGMVRSNNQDSAIHCEQP
jgi:hypothetical protein